MADGRKTGGRRKGTPNKPKLIVSPEQLAKDRAVALMAAPDEFRSPKAVMLSAMLKFDRMSNVLMSKAERMTVNKAAYGDIKEVVDEAYKFTFAAVNCADRVAPYIHARLMAIESRGDNVNERAPFVIRAPAVMADSSTWQAAVGSAVIEMEAAQPSPVVRQSDAGATLQAQAPQNAPATTPVRLTADQSTGRVTIMPPGAPRVVQPSGTEEWLASVKRTG